MSKRVYTASQWRVTMEHRNGEDRQTFYMVAKSGYRAQYIARAKLQVEGKKPRYWTMIGLARLSA